jgi:anti-anti-sigma factor
MTRFQIRTTEDGDDRMRISVQGELDIATASELERELRASLSGGDVVLDLEPVSFMDSSGLRALLVASREAREAGRRLLVLPGTGQVLRVIEMAQVSEHLELADGT